MKFLHQRQNEKEYSIPKYKANNQGSTLLTVIFCIAIICILGSLMMSLAMTNLQMKLVESKSKENFYTCEKAMEEIRTAIQEITAEEIKNVYEDEVLNNYAAYLSMTQETRNLTIQNMVVVKLLKDLGEIGSLTDTELLSGSSITLQSERFTDYLTDSVHTSINPAERAQLYSETGGTVVRLAGLEVEYVRNDYRSSITSDIVITLPDFAFIDGSSEIDYQTEQPFLDYILVADHQIISDQAVSNTNLNGNIYAGTGGILVKGRNAGGNHLSILGNQVVTRGDITVSDTAKLTIGAAGNLPVIWADNLITLTSETYPLGSSLRTELTINGISIIKDDLTLEGRNSKVDLQSGAYIGYTGGTNSAKGSAVMINGAGSSLNLSGLSELVLAGRAHVSVEDKNNHKETNILTGESVAFKSNQKAYLLPREFISGILHNPITQADYNLMGKPIVEVKDTPQIPYSTYVASGPDTMQYTIAAMQTGTTTLRYYYLNFANGKKADAYLKQYISLYSDTISQLEPFSLREVLLPDRTKTFVVGNMMSYDTLTGKVALTDGQSKDYTDDTSLDQAVADYSLSNTIYTNTVLENKYISELSRLYPRITHLLTASSTKSYVETADVKDIYIKAGGVNYLIDNPQPLSATTLYTDYTTVNGDEVVTNIDSARQSFHIVKGNVTIAAGAVFNGFLCATGNITIGDGATVNGLLVATGEDTDSSTITVGNQVTVKGRLVADDIVLGQNCTIYTDTMVEGYLAQLFQEEGTILNNLFRYAKPMVSYHSNSGSTVDLSKMISYENWHKTE